MKISKKQLALVALMVVGQSAFAMDEVELDSQEISSSLDKIRRNLKKTLADRIMTQNEQMFFDRNEYPGLDLQIAYGKQAIKDYLEKVHDFFKKAQQNIKQGRKYQMLTPKAIEIVQALHKNTEAIVEKWKKAYKMQRDPKSLNPERTMTYQKEFEQISRELRKKLDAIEEIVDDMIDND